MFYQENYLENGEWRCLAYKLKLQNMFYLDLDLDLVIDLSFWNVLHNRKEISGAQKS